MKNPETKLSVKLGKVKMIITLNILLDINLV